MGKYAIVDKEDNVIGYKKHADILTSDIYRVSVLWVTNTKKQILLAKRALNKSHNPGLWEPAVAGTIEVEESYKENIIKEAEEEIGLKIEIRNLVMTPKLFLTDNVSGWQFFCQVFIYKSDLDINKFILQKDEVMDLKWFDRAEIVSILKTDVNKFVPNFGTIFGLAKEYRIN